MWLGIGMLSKIKVGGELQRDAQSSVKLISSDLIKIFNGNMRWKATELDSTDCSLICSVLEPLKVENEKFIADLGDIVRHTISKSSEIDLVLMCKGTFYMRNFKHTKDLYSIVHAESMKRSNLK